MNLGKTIKIVLLNKGLNQKDLIEKTGLSKTTISLILNDQTMPRKENLEAIALALDLKPEVLLLMSIEKEDVPEGKRDIFDAMWPSVENTFYQVFLKK